MDKINIFKNIKEYITKDTQAKNESKKTVVVIRIILISLMVYFLANIVVGNVLSDITDIRNLIFFACFAIAFIGLFACTYYFRTRPVYWIFNIAMLIFIVVILVLFGWNVGVQHFLIVMLMLNFFSVYNRHKQKFVVALLLCVVRLILFHIFYGREPFLPIPSSINSSLQTINTIAIFWCLSVIAYVFSKDGQEMESKLVEYNIQLEQQANTDKLTGLYNRRKAWDYLESLTEGKHTHSFSLCICDIDWFKKVNDTYGHDVGDEVLKGIASIFAEEMQGKDMVARWGGEEFLLVFPDTNGDHAYTRLEHIRSRIKDLKVQKGDVEVRVTMTFGLAEYNYNGGFEATIKDADRKLYRGKEEGRDRIVY